MSFLTYTSHPVLFAASVGGVTIGVALLLLPWKNMSFGNLSFHSPSKTPLQLTSGEGNCEVVTDTKKVVQEVPFTFNDYVGVICEQRKGDDYIFTTKWVALFPRSLFIEEVNELSTNHKISIETETYDPIANDEKGLFKTIFKSHWFISNSNNQIIGEWNYERPISFRDLTLYPVEIVSTKNSINTEFIYLQLLGR